MNDVENLTALIHTYQQFRGIATDNLRRIGGGRARRGRLLTGTLGRLVKRAPDGVIKTFPLGETQNLLCAERDGRKISRIYGALYEEIGFYPTITENILKLHSIINSVNQKAEAGRRLDLGLAHALQYIIMGCLFLEKAFLYLSLKLEQPATAPQALKACAQEFDESVAAHAGIFLDHEYINALRTEQPYDIYEFRDYLLQEADATDDGKMLNGYFVPQSLWEPFLNFVSQQEAFIDGTGDFDSGGTGTKGFSIS